MLTRPTGLPDPDKHYAGYKSVLNGPDSAAIAILINLHSENKDPRILDCTWGRGAIWRGCAYQPDIRLDLRPMPGLDVRGDFNALGLATASFDVVIFDPPHIPAYRGEGGGIYSHRYGIGADCGQENINGTFLPALTEIKRVLRPGGIVLAKISDIVHNIEYQWQQVGFVNAARACNFVPCDMLIKCDPAAGNLVSPNWGRQLHLRRAHCYWIVLRNAKRCARTWRRRTKENLQMALL